MSKKQASVEKPVAYVPYLKVGDKVSFDLEGFVRHGTVTRLIPFTLKDGGPWTIVDGKYTVGRSFLTKEKS